MPCEFPIEDLPGFPVSAVSGHAGEVVAGRLGGVPVIMLSGRVHFYEKGDANAMRLPIEVLKGLGVAIADSDQFGRVSARGNAARLGDADHRPYQLFRHESADRRGKRPSLRRHDQCL